MRIAASKYDPTIDPHMPKVGDVVNGNQYLKVEPIETSALMKMVEEGKIPEPIVGSDDVLVLNNPDRPFLKYLVWVKFL